MKKIDFEYNECPWLFEGTPFTSEDICNYYGFVYLITNLQSGKMYVGRKYFWQCRKPRGKKRRVKSESDWQEYFSSSKLVVADVLEIGVKNFRREILSLHERKGDVNYWEVKEQFSRDVLESLDSDGNRVYYNNNIMSRYFSITEDGIEKMREKLKGRKLSEETKRRMRASGIGKNKGNPPWCKDQKLSEDHKNKISDSLTGRKRGEFSKETKKKMSKAHRGKKRKPFSEETKRKMKESALKRWRNNEKSI